MHINNILSNYLYDKKEYVLWNNNNLYIYGVKKLSFLSDDKITINLINNSLTINGKNLKVKRCNENELIVDGDIYAIQK